MKGKPSFLRIGGWFALIFAWLAGSTKVPADTGADFEAANLLYEKGRFAEAAHAYEALIAQEVRSPAILFNAGNAWFKAGRTGRAVAHWLEAEASAPRNERIQINLEFARKAVTGGAIPVPLWPVQLRLLTLNEWASITLATTWLFCGSLALGAWRPSWRNPLRVPVVLAGLALMGVIALTTMTARDRARTVIAVVIADEAVVHFGPLNESASAFVARDGSEFRVTDRKEEWLRVEDALGREGWLLATQVVQIKAGRMVARESLDEKRTPVPVQASL